MSAEFGGGLVGVSHTLMLSGVDISGKSRRDCSPFSSDTASMGQKLKQLN